MLYIEDNIPLQDINLNKEIERGKMYCELNKTFLNSCLKNLDQKVFSNKKKYIRTISNLLASWMFTLYSKYDFKDDPFFPTNYKYFDNLIETINDYCSLYLIENRKIKIKNIIDNLSCSYQNILDRLKTLETNIDYKITKTIILQKRNNMNIKFYKFNINYNKYINEKIKNLLDNIIIPIDKYNLLINKYNKKYSGNVDDLIWIILYRYQLLSSNNNQLAVLPTILDLMNTDFNLNFECFASTINSNTKKYCSLYFDVEYYFGSIGSFFNTKVFEGCYSFNPPYQKDIIDNGILKILNHLDISTLFDLKLTFIITIPIWDEHGKLIMKQLNSENNNNNIKYKDMKIMTIIKKSKYFKGLRMLSKNDFTYIDHNFHLFKNITIQNTYIIVLSNDNNDFFDKINKYNFKSII